MIWQAEEEATRGGEREWFLEEKSEPRNPEFFLSRDVNHRSALSVYIMNENFWRLK
jgi:hypothetical protein